MYFLQSRHSPYQISQLLQPSFAYMLANPEETIKCDRSNEGCGRVQDDNAAFSSGNMHFVDENDRFLVYTDLPGVKAEDLKVEFTDKGIIRIYGERKKGEQSTKFDRQFCVDDQSVEVCKITASLSDGTLEIVAPKKETSKPWRVAVVAGSPSENKNAHSFDVEIPGVKIDALQVEVQEDGKLKITGERKRGGQTKTIQKAFSLNQRAVDTSKLEAFLEDGILTIRAPPKEPLVGRVIPVNAPTDPVNNTDDTNVEDSDKAQATTSPENKEDIEEFHDVVETENKEPSSDKPVGEEKSASSEMEFEVVPETVNEDDEDC